MSDEKVRAAIEQMEAWLSEPGWEPDPEALILWNADFKAAMAQTERGVEWPDLVARAHVAGRLLESRTTLVARERDSVRAELEVQERGNRALQGYRAITR